MEPIPELFEKGFLVVDFAKLVKGPVIQRFTTGHSYAIALNRGLTLIFFESMMLPSPS
jgi:hypothetical protein